MTQDNETPESENPEAAGAHAGGGADGGAGGGAGAPEAGNGQTGDTGERTYEELVAENADLKDKLLRTLAEMENLRKRSEKDKEDMSKFAIAKFARDLLTVADNFDRALQALPDEARETADENFKNLIVGLELTDRELHAAFKRHGIDIVRPAGERFDPNFHQAIAEVPHQEHGAGICVDVVQPGYVIGDRLLRPAMVTVSKGPGSGAADGAAAGTHVNKEV